MVLLPRMGFRVLLTQSPWAASLCFIFTVGFTIKRMHQYPKKQLVHKMPNIPNHLHSLCSLSLQSYRCLAYSAICSLHLELCLHGQLSQQ